MDDDDREYLNYMSTAIHERHHEETWQQIRSCSGGSQRNPPISVKAIFDLNWRCG
jgi:hypothetical protein